MQNSATSSESTRLRYVIGTGWWCAGAATEQRKVMGDDSIRGSAFHALWYESICRFTSPEKILIVDSASPVPPPIDPSDPRLELVSLNFNAGHATNLKGKYCGWMRSVLLGAQYALMCDTDYFVYVEQDVLLYGKGIVEHCASKMTTPFMFGAPADTPQPLQQSFFIVRRDGLAQLLEGIHKIAQRDNEIAPEVKFAMAATKRFWRLMGFLACRQARSWRINAVRNYMMEQFRGFDWLPIGHGRSKPIDFGQPYFYFQHGTTEEIEQYRQHLLADGNPRRTSL